MAEGKSESSNLLRLRRDGHGLDSESSEANPRFMEPLPRPEPALSQDDWFGLSAPFSCEPESHCSLDPSTISVDSHRNQQDPAVGNGDHQAMSADSDADTFREKTVRNLAVLLRESDIEKRQAAMVAMIEEVRGHHWLLPTCCSCKYSTHCGETYLPCLYTLHKPCLNVAVESIDPTLETLMVPLVNCSGATSQSIEQTNQIGTIYLMKASVPIHSF
jgi:hypothetical protein